MGELCTFWAHIDTKYWATFELFGLSESLDSEAADLKLGVTGTKNRREMVGHKRGTSLPNVSAPLPGLYYSLIRMSIAKNRPLPLLDI